MWITDYSFSMFFFFAIKMDASLDLVTHLATIILVVLLLHEDRARALGFQENNNNKNIYIYIYIYIYICCFSFHCSPKLCLCFTLIK